MTKTIPSGRAQSIRDRLYNLFKKEEVSFDLLLARYAQERFLYRLAKSGYRDRLMLKGGLLFTAITDRFGRATRDIDVLADIDNNEDSYRGVIIEIIGTPVDDDGVTFDAQSVGVKRIIVHDDQQGLRATFQGTLAGARLNVQIDAGFGDKVLLPEEEFVYPALLDDVPPPIIRAYSVESVIAEKFEAIADLGELSTRFKDYDDVAQLAKSREFQASALYAAVNMTFSNRETSPNSVAVALDPARATAEREVGWVAYRSKLHAKFASPTLAETLELLRTFWSGIEAFQRDGVSRKWLGGWSVL